MATAASDQPEPANSQRGLEGQERPETLTAEFMTEFRTELHKQKKGTKFHAETFLDDKIETAIGSFFSFEKKVTWVVYDGDHDGSGAHYACEFPTPNAQYVKLFIIPTPNRRTVTLDDSTDDEAPSRRNRRKDPAAGKQSTGKQTGTSSGQAQGTSS